MNVLYSTFTVLLVAACTRLAVGAGARTPSYYLLASAVSVLCISDLLITLEGTGRLSSTIPELVAPIVFVLFGASAIAPHDDRLTEPPLEDVPRLTWRRIVLLGVALMTSPAVIVWAQVQHQEVDVPVIVIGSVALAALVLARLTDLVHGQERTATTEQVLREASASLVTSTGRHMMNRSTLQAVTRLAGDAHELRVSMALVIDRGLQVVDAVGYEAENAIGTAAYLDSLEEGMAPALFRREAASFDKTAAIDLGPEADQTPRAVLVAPLVSQNELSGAIVVTTRKPLARTTRRSIEALASTVSLALESAYPHREPAAAEERTAVPGPGRELLGHRAGGGRDRADHLRQPGRHRVCSAFPRRRSCRATPTSGCTRPTGRQPRQLLDRSVTDQVDTKARGAPAPPCRRRPTTGSRSGRAT